MWISYRKRILLWHTARNILAIFYLLQIGVTWCCDQLDPRFDSLESKAYLSEIIVTARVINLTQTSYQTRRDYKSFTASVYIISVLQNRNSAPIKRKTIVDIDGFIPNPQHEPTAQSTDTPTSLDSELKDNPHCLSNVSLDTTYIIFINRSDQNNSHSLSRILNPNSHLYYTAQIATTYTLQSQKKVRKLCDVDGCKYSAPNAKSKRNLDISEGAYNYKISCRADGVPPPDVRWYKDGIELNNDIRGIAVKHREKNKQQIAILRIKTVELEHAGTYKCIAKNLVGEDMAKARLRVTPSSIAPKPDPTPPGSDIWSSITEEESVEEPEAPSHYIPCPEKDRGYCLHGGECQMFPDGRYKHCNCKAGFAGARCEEAFIIPPTAPPNKKQSKAPSVQQIQPESGVDLVIIVTALAAVLGVLVIFLLILAFYCAGWRYHRRRERRLERHYQKTSTPYSPPESAHLLDETDCGRLKGASPFSSPIKQVYTMATQTEPCETSLQQIRRSLNLENFFPHSSSDVVLRRKSSNAGHHSRPASQPAGRPATARSRLSGTSTITESKRPINDGEFNVLPEQVPSSASIQLDADRNGSLCGADNSLNNPQAHCDQDSVETNCSLYISETSTSTTSSSSCESDDVDNRQRRPYTKSKSVNGLIRHSKNIGNNNNSKAFTPQYSGCD